MRNVMLILLLAGSVAWGSRQFTNRRGGVIYSRGVFVAAANAPENDKKDADYVCDGTADEVELGLALDKGHHIVLSGGTFVIDNWVIDSDCWLDCQIDTVLQHKAAGSSAAILFTGTDFQLTNGVMDGNRANQPTTRTMFFTTDLVSGKSATFRDVVFTGSVYAPVRFQKFGGQALFDGCTFEDMAEAGSSQQLSGAIIVVSGQCVASASYDDLGNGYGDYVIYKASTDFSEYEVGDTIWVAEKDNDGITEINDGIWTVAAQGDEVNGTGWLTVTTTAVTGCSYDAAGHAGGSHVIYKAGTDFRDAFDDYDVVYVTETTDGEISDGYYTVSKVGTGWIALTGDAGSDSAGDVSIRKTLGNDSASDIYFSKYKGNLVVQNCRFFADHPETDGDAPGGIFFATDFNRSTLVLDNCYFQGIGQNSTIAGTDIGCVHTYNTAGGVRITNNYMEDFGFNPLVLKGSHDCVVIGNYICNGQTSDKMSANDGAIHYTPGYWGYGEEQPRATITGNIVISPGSEGSTKLAGIGVRGGVSSPARNWVIANNVLEDVGKGVYMDRAADGTIMGNRIVTSTSGAAGEEDGIDADNITGRIFVTGNDIECHNGECIFAVATVAESDWIITNNIFTTTLDTEYGVNLRGMNFLRVSGNTFNNPGSKTALIRHAEGNIDNIYWGNDNVIVNNASSNFSIWWDYITSISGGGEVLLARKKGVNLQTEAKQTLYTCRTEKAFVTRVVLHSLSAAVDCPTGISFGTDNNDADNWLAATDISECDTTTEQWVFSPFMDNAVSNVLRLQNGNVFGVDIATGTGAASALTATIDVFGYEF